MNELETLLNELSSFDIPAQNKQIQEQPKRVNVTEDNLNDYLLKKASALVDISLDAVEELKPFVMQGTDPDEIAALAEVINASSKAMENLNKLLMQKKKLENDIKLKKIDFEHKKELAATDSPKAQTINNNVYIASREEIFKKFINTEQPVSEIEEVEVREAKQDDQ